MENTIRITGGRQGTSCPGCLEPLGPDEATRRCPEGHIAIHAECQDLVSSCPLLSCGLPLLTEPTFEELQSELDGAIITREVAADDGPAEGTRSRSRPRCPACGAPNLAAGQAAAGAGAAHEPVSDRSYGVAVALCGIFGIVGIHHFYLGNHLHGLFDLLHPAVIDNSGVPAWWPAFCAAVDLVLGGWVLLLAGRVQRNGPPPH